MVPPCSCLVALLLRSFAGPPISQEHVEEVSSAWSIELAHGIPQAHVRLGRLEVDGVSIDRRALRAAVRKQRPRLRRCLESSPLYDRESARSLSVELIVDPEGSTYVTLHGSLGDASSNACVLRSLEPATAALPRGTRVTFSLALGVR